MHKTTNTPHTANIVTSSARHGLGFRNSCFRLNSLHRKGLEDNRVNFFEIVIMLAWSFMHHLPRMIIKIGQLNGWMLLYKTNCYVTGAADVIWRLPGLTTQRD